MERRAAAVPALAAAVLAVALGCAAASRPAPAPTAAAAASAVRPRAVVLFIGDGMGFPQLAVTRDLLYGKGERLALERGLPVTGIVSTWSASNFVTDSGAAATALGCGVKTDNREVGRDPGERPLRCIAEVARAHGWRIGYVTTTRITHATPAAFYAHGQRYDDEAGFAPQLLAQAPDLALGGGAGLFLPASAGGDRKDGRDLLAAARQAGYTVWTQAAEVAAPPPARLLGLFARDHLPFELDREGLPEAERPPSLAALTRLALDVLGREDGGFFLMVEGGRIDHAAHGFDPAGTAAETRAFDRAVEEALAFQRAAPGHAPAADRRSRHRRPGDQRRRRLGGARPAAGVGRRAGAGAARRGGERGGQGGDRLRADAGGGGGGAGREGRLRGRAGARHRALAPPPRHLHAQGQPRRHQGAHRRGRPPLRRRPGRRALRRRPRQRRAPPPPGGAPRLGMDAGTAVTAREQTHRRPRQAGMCSVQAGICSVQTYSTEESTFVPSESKLAPGLGASVLLESTYVPPESTLVPGDGTHVPAAGTLVPAESTLVPSVRYACSRRKYA